MALKASVSFQCIRLILEAEFGYSIEFVEGQLPRFYLRDVPVDILNDE